MINLTYTPQRADFKAEYSVDGDKLTVMIEDAVETFDFTEIPEGVYENLEITNLPINPILYVERVGDIINVTVFEYYTANEKHLYENI